MNVAIVGMGLIGGSLARSIKTRTSHAVYGFDLDSEVMMLARICGAIDGTLDDASLEKCDLVLVAICPDAAINWVSRHAYGIKKSAVVIDMCGVKRAVCAPMAEAARQHGFTFVGGHPMAGKELAGFVNSTPDLYEGSSMILTPDENTDIRTLELLKAFFTDIGFAALTFTDPVEHDRIIAYTSQLAHIVSSAYVRSPEAQRRRGFSAGSFRDMTRVARLDENVWTELMMDNADNLSEQLDILMQNLEQYRTALRNDEGDMLRALLRDGREKKATAGGN